jgi:histone-lysine N-methyltransferase SUV39H
MFFKQNHSCDPNCAISASYINEANLDKPLLALFTRRDVLPWEELSFSYTGYDSDEEVSKSCCCMPWLSPILV